MAPAPSGQRLIRSIAPDGRVILTDPTTGTTVPPTAMAGRKVKFETSLCCFCVFGHTREVKLLP